MTATSFFLIYMNVRICYSWPPNRYRCHVFQVFRDNTQPKLVETEGVISYWIFASKFKQAVAEIYPLTNMSANHLIDWSYLLSFHCVTYSSGENWRLKDSPFSPPTIPENKIVHMKQKLYKPNSPVYILFTLTQGNTIQDSSNEFWQITILWRVQDK